uniref:NADH dehydrogenase subunit 6 n=1 Tax=Gilpinia tabulaeformis TaxID=2982312 RepID=UPI0023F28ABD|nr:NADH dehydrogenase subunit 6 [Gilpinia tabulaeformis]WDY84715.1 NADH dehydrogenase subunit 6 [Gilpinia tabulaeformis]
MMMKIIILIMLINTILMYLMNTPFSMGLILLFQTFMISIMSGMMTLSFWYSYIIFLIILGSMLIIFIYISSLISNIKFMINKWMMMNLFIIILISMLLINFNKINLLHEDTLNFSNLMELNMSTLKISLNKLFNFPTFTITFLMMNYLFITLIIVVKISNINLGSLRKTF